MEQKFIQKQKKHCFKKLFKKRIFQYWMFFGPRIFIILSAARPKAEPLANRRLNGAQEWGPRSEQNILMIFFKTNIFLQEIWLFFLKFLLYFLYKMDLGHFFAISKILSFFFLSFGIPFFIFHNRCARISPAYYFTCKDICKCILPQQKFFEGENLIL